MLNLNFLIRSQDKHQTPGEPLSTLLVSPLRTLIIVSCIIPYITPALRSLDYGTGEARPTSEAAGRRTKKRKGDPKEGYRYPLGNIIYGGNGKEDGNYYIILGVI